jgi:hypothetical protein
MSALSREGGIHEHFLVLHRRLRANQTAANLYSFGPSPEEGEPFTQANMRGRIFKRIEFSHIQVWVSVAAVGAYHLESFLFRRVIRMRIYSLTIPGSVLGNEAI